MSESESMQAEQPQVDPAQLAYAVERLRSEENFLFASIAGIAAAAVGAAAWTAITVLTGYQIGFMAVGVGIAVALCIRVAGRGMSQKFQILGAVLSLLGCVAGNFLTVCYFIGLNEGMPLLDVLVQIDPAVIPDIMISTFSGMDLLFYGIAVYEGYRLSLRPVSESDLTGLA